MSDIEQRLREVMDGVTPLEWVPWLDNGSVQAHTPFGSYTVEAPDEEIDRVGWSWRYCFDEYYDEDTFTCDDLESGKRAAQDNWNERMSRCVNMDTIVSLRSKLEEAEGALEKCQRVLAMMTDGKMSKPSVVSAFAQCVEAELAARRTLASLREADHA